MFNDPLLKYETNGSYLAGLPIYNKFLRICPTHKVFHQYIDIDLRKI